MSQWADQVRAILQRTPTGVLSLPSIEGELKSEGLFLREGDPWLLAEIREDQETFLVLPSRLGPWSTVKESVPEKCLPGDPWVALRSLPDPGIGRGATLRRRLGEGILVWAEALDKTSPPSVARWIRANLESCRICLALARGLPGDQVS